MDNFSKRMAALYEAMQKAYDDVAKHYGGFSCQGCTDNCCTQRFFHHTIAEYRYLKEGMLVAMREDPELARQIILKARQVVSQYPEEIEEGQIRPLMCPVNFEGLCKLYMHRPMICRMHGMPHRFRLPDGREQRGSGCSVFEESNKADWTVNRTSFYKELSDIERAERHRLGMGGKYARTTAEMIIDMLDDEPDLLKLVADSQ